MVKVKARAPKDGVEVSHWIVCLEGGLGYIFLSLSSLHHPQAESDFVKVFL